MRAVAGLAALALLVGAASAAPAPARFRLQGQLQPAAPTASADRFSLRADLLPAAPRPDAAARFVIAARLDRAAKAACARPERIFGHGFEDP